MIWVRGCPGGEMSRGQCPTLDRWLRHFGP